MASEAQTNAFYPPRLEVYMTREFLLLTGDSWGKHPTVPYLPQRVKLGSLGDGVLAGLVLVDAVVIHRFPIDEGQCVGASFLPFSQSGWEGGGI